MNTKITTSRPFLHKAYSRFKPLIKSKNSTTYLTLTLSLFTLSFFGLFGIKPTLVTAFSLIKSVADLKKLNIDYENKIGNLIRAQSEFEQIRDSIPLIDAALPSTTDFTKLAKTIEKFADTENISIEQLQIDKISISKLPPDGKLYNYGFSLVGTGSYSSITAFIGHLINWKRVLSINSMQISREVGTGSAKLNLSLKGNTYYEP